MAYEVIGQGWWQWDGEGHDFDDDRDTIWVVVHDNVELAALDLRFPVREAERCDYRYLALDAARAYLAAHIDELETDPDLKAVHDRLVATSTRIEEHFSIE